MQELITLSRRDVFQRTLRKTAQMGQHDWPVWMPRMAFAEKNQAPKGDVLVCIFLRGGADGLNIIVPHGDDAYYKSRPKIAIARPDQQSADKNQKALDLDGFFGIHPALASLLPFFQANQIVAVHATGSPDPTHSHFEAMDYMERGTPGSFSLNTGWIGRHLASLDTGTNAALRAIGWGGTLQQSLRGSVNAIALDSILDYHLRGRDGVGDQMVTVLNTLYALDLASLKESADQTNAVLNIVKKINISSYRGTHGANYDPNNYFHMALMQTAALVKADVGLEVSAIDLGGWDTHQNQLTDQAGALTRLASGLSNFATDMDVLMKKVTIVIMSEFGRRVAENASAGTDHGHGNMMMVMGGNVVNKPVIAQWPGLADDKLADGDLTITIDYRDVLSEILIKRLNNPQVNNVFPNFTPTTRGIILS